MSNDAREAIRSIVEEAYIRGIHTTQDEATVRAGFHQDFAMLVLQDDTMLKVGLDEWFERVEALKADSPELWKAETRGDFLLIDVSGTAAVVKLDVYKGETFFSTDYMLLYKFEKGWRIVSKVFTIMR